MDRYRARQTNILRRVVKQLLSDNSKLDRYQRGKSRDV